MKKSDVVATVCSEAECPVIRAKHVEHWRMPGPAKMGLEKAGEVRNEIKRKVVELIERIASGLSLNNGCVTTTEQVFKFN